MGMSGESKSLDMEDQNFRCAEDLKLLRCLHVCLALSTVPFIAFLENFPLCERFKGIF